LTTETNPDDADLVAATRRGDRAAYAALYERHRSMLAALFWRALGDASLAEDAVQEAALRGMLGIDTLRRPETFGSWLGGIGLNVCREWLRRRPPEVRSWEALAGGRYIAEPTAAEADPIDQAVELDVAGRVRAAVEGLPGGQRAAVVLYYLEGLTLAEVAAQLGIPAGAVKARLHKARAHLRRDLRDLREEEVEESMSEKPASTEPVEVHVADVRRTRVGSGETAQVQGHIVLQEINGTRSLVIWVGENEAVALALLREGVAFPRPQTYQLTDSLLRSVDARILGVTVERLADDVYYASILVEGPNGQHVIDARPSDAINLALLAGAPIRAVEEVFAAAGSISAPSTPTDAVVEHGPEIAARTMEHWQKQLAAHLASRQSTETTEEKGAGHP
jgi:RNA polymerase sigma factor (sigma-70 family)